MAPADAPDRRDARGVPTRRRRWTDLLVAAGTAVVTLGLLLGLPPLDAMDPDTAGTMGAGPGFPDVGGTAWTLLAITLVAQSALLLGARRAPRSVLLAVGALPILLALVSTSAAFGLTALPVVVAVVLATLRVPLPRLWPAVAGSAVLVAVGTGITWAHGSGAMRSGVVSGLGASAGQGVLQAVGAVGLPLVVTLIVRSRRELRAARRAESDARTAAADARTAAADARTAEAAALAREQDARVEAAVSRERAAMARELHDIAAHHLSGIALMSAVVDRQIDTDPDGAHEGVRQVREQSTAVLEDLRRLVGLLRDDTPAETVVETVAGIVDLVEAARTRSAVELTVQPGDHPLADGIGPLTQLVAYRTVQEALANVALHAAGAPCRVTVDDRDPDHLTVRVENGVPTAPSVGSSPSGGNGLRGMRERAELVGARLQVGPTGDGGWTVELVTAREARPAADTSADAPEVAG
ncbi:histidine kinase [Curtobacterium sp. SORGH_AS_0776]|uniref:sensor histidine kinase n=1 Tax=Curtobacterium sp. SORGH_AS_0776 TaxID=3041798 RepID=UPI00285521E0|nr:histidine kinase [Curtobacterium sp. SORGH_AS_0776]MDR6171898.1 signal transduction histidine kinase [Curtobacterium sp. SORGH_AS_0776]